MAQKKGNEGAEYRGTKQGVTKAPNPDVVKPAAVVKEGNDMRSKKK